MYQKNTPLKAQRMSSYAKAPPQEVGNPLNEDVQDVVRETANWINNFVKNDPFASTIIGLVVMILLLGGVFLSVV